MCHRPHHVQTRPSSTTNNSKRSSKRRSKTTVSLKPSRKTRTKRKKPKYLSLNLKISSQKTPQASTKKTEMPAHKKQQLNLFPLHPENLVDDNNVVDTFLFDAATDSTTTLNGLLSTCTTATTNSKESPLSTPSLTYTYRGQDNSEEGDSNDGLVRTAMRCKERDASEERWVSYSEVVEKNIKEEEVNSCVDDDGDDVGGDAWCLKQLQDQKRKPLLALKLDYEEILNAWSDKGPLYVDGDSPQTVPDFDNDHDVGVDALGSIWSVPEISNSDGGDSKVKNDQEVGWKTEHREASMLRYKEKRQNRLFSKRIRYEVRKLNAEKRPRMKGRFVKRS